MQTFQDKTLLNGHLQSKKHAAPLAILIQNPTDELKIQGGISIRKRVKTLFGPYFQKKLELKAKEIIDLEKKTGKSFSDFELLE